MFGIFSKKQKMKEEELNARIELIKNESLERILSLEKALRMKNEEFEAILQEKNAFSNEQKIKMKQEGVIEKNLRELKKENDQLKEKVAYMRAKSIFNPLPVSEHQYKIPLERYFTSARHEGHITIFKSLGRDYVCEIEDGDFQNLLEDKNLEEFKKHHEKFVEGYLDLDTKILATKGERIGKIYNKNRKFVTFAHENNLEFMDDIKDFNFYKLMEKDFKSEMIEELISKNIEYQNMYKK